MVSRQFRKCRKLQSNVYQMWNRFQFKLVYWMIFEVVHGFAVIFCRVSFLPFVSLCSFFRMSPLLAFFLRPAF